MINVRNLLVSKDAKHHGNLLKLSNIKKNPSTITMKATIHTIPTTKPANLSNKEERIADKTQRKGGTADKMEAVVDPIRRKRMRYLKIMTRKGHS